MRIHTGVDKNVSGAVWGFENNCWTFNVDSDPYKLYKFCYENLEKGNVYGRESFMWFEVQDSEVIVKPFLEQEKTGTNTKNVNHFNTIFSCFIIILLVQSP